MFSWLFRRDLWYKGWIYLKTKGVKKTVDRLNLFFREKIWEKFFLHQDNEKRYSSWWQSQQLGLEELKKISQQARNLPYQPKISVLVPVFDVPAKYLEACLASVENQIYTNWELCLADDASSHPDTLRVINQYVCKAKENSRIKIIRHQKNKHISITTNSALSLATGEFVALLDNDDLLHPLALFLMVKKLNQNPKLDFIYSDEDKINRRGKHIDPYFKSDWNPDLLLSMNYICHLALIRREIMVELGGMRQGLEGSQDFDLFLRLTEKTDRIGHIPFILYHWRQIAGSTSMTYSSKNYANLNAKKALIDAGLRRKIDWSVLSGLAPTSFRVKRKIKNNQEIGIIIPFKDKVNLLKQCVSSVLAKTDYANYKIFLINNNSVEDATKKYLQEIRKQENIKILNYDKPFNFSALNNWAVRQISSPLILLLNNDTEVINGGWLSAMAEQIERPEVGAVGAKLLYQNGKIQHAGVVLGLGRFEDKDYGIAGHSHKYFPKGSHGYFEQIDVIRDYSAVTGACLLTRKKLFEKMGGLDEKNFSVAWNDVDYCLRLRQKGFLIVYTPYARLFHYESVSRGSDENGSAKKRFHRECQNMYDRWGDLLANDPYYNLNLSLENESFRIKSQSNLQNLTNL